VPTTAVAGNVARRCACSLRSSSGERWSAERARRRALFFAAEAIRLAFTAQPRDVRASCVPAKMVRTCAFSQTGLRARDAATLVLVTRWSSWAPRGSSPARAPRSCAAWADRGCALVARRHCRRAREMRDRGSAPRPSGSGRGSTRSTARHVCAAAGASRRDRAPRRPSKTVAALPRASC
jgi:hypothetical protein